MKLAPKLTLLFFFLSIAPTAVVGYLSYESGRRTIIQNSEDHLISVNIFKSNELKRWIEDNKAGIEELAQRPLVRRYAAVLIKHDISNPEYHNARDSIIEDHLKPRLKYGGFFEIFVMCPQHGHISASTDESQEGKFREFHPYYIKGKRDGFVQGVYYSPSLEQAAMTISTPIKDKQGNLLGVLAGRLDLGELSKIIALQTDKSPTEDTYLVNSFNFFVTEPRFGQAYALKKAVRTEGVQAGLSGKDGINFYMDYRGVPVIGAYKWLSQFNMCIITEVDQEKAFAPIVRLAWIITGIASAISVAAGFLGLVFAQTITRPARKLLAGAEEIGAGNLDVRVGTKGNDEICELSRTFDRMAHDLKGITVSRDELIKEVTERKRLQAQLIQSQKMESVGRLAGGVAHDFNNMLGVILGHAEMAMEKAGASDPIQADLEEIRKAAKRSADLTRHLLAFARKEIIRPQVLDLNDAVTGMIKMLRRLIGEDIHLAWMPGGGLWPIKVDPAQIDQILTNLCVNARDAIAGVGKVTIETQNIILDDTYCADHAEFVPGTYVMLSVSDDGCGMDKGTLEHLFEPFFTTKEVGKGTGLGLATVYGIVKQNEGFINVYSEPGQGTTLKLYFPKTTEAVGAKSESVVKTPARGTETVLLVEDEEAILTLGKTILERFGYTVLASRTPKDAITIVDRYGGPIHLLVTDVVMPEMNGKQLKESIAKIKPQIKVLYMSGYTANVILHRGILENEVHFIQKPFSINSLAGKVREVLDQKF